MDWRRWKDKPGMRGEWGRLGLRWQEGGCTCHHSTEAVRIGVGAGEVSGWLMFSSSFGKKQPNRRSTSRCCFIPHQPLLSLFRPLLKAVDRCWLDWHGCEHRGPGGSVWNLLAVRTGSGEGKGLEARDSTELSTADELCIKMQLQAVFPWNEQSAKTKIRSRHSHPTVCSRTLGWGHL